MRLSYLPLSHNAVLSALFVAALAVSYASRATAVMGAYLVLAFVAVLANAKVFSQSSQRERNVTLALVLVTSIMLPISLLRSLTGVIHYAVVLVSLGAAYVLTRDTNVYVRASRWVLVSAQLYIFSYLVRHGIRNFPLQDIIPNSSSNGVTSYVVLLQANYCIVNYVQTRRTSLLTALATLAICVVGFGRGSVLAATGIVIAGAVCRVFLAGKGRAFFVSLLVLVTSVFLSIRYSEQILVFVNSNTKIGSGLFDAHRYEMIVEYLDKIDASTLWTGASYTGTSIASEYNNNPHNSFIRAHHIFGLPYLLLMLCIPVYLVHRKHAFSVKAYAGCVWMVVMFRASTEPILFPTLLDFFFFGVCFVLSQDPHYRRVDLGVRSS
ncbi:MAG: hypothetical protein AB7P31_03385 [Steroidobacteraceae bacterium]